MDAYPDRVVPIVYHTHLGATIDDLGLGLSGTYWNVFDVGVTVNLNINRKHKDLAIMPGSKETNKTTWYDYAKLADEAIAAVDIEHSWNSLNRKIDGKIKVTFDQAPNGSELSVALFIVEDSVVGGPRYDQMSEYSWFGNYPELEGKETILEADSVHFAGGPWIVGYAHHWSFRESVLEGDFWGTTTPIPSDAEVGKEYLIPFSHSLPGDYHSLDVVDRHVELVAFIAYKDKEVLNVESANLVKDAVSINKTKLKYSNDVNIAQRSSFVELSLAKRDSYTVFLFNLAGKMIYEKNIANSIGKEILDISMLSSGTYLIKIEGTDFNLNKSFVKLRQ